MAGSRPRASHQYLTLAAMIFAVSMTFIDMTIVAIASPEIQKELGLSQEGLQWVINGYLLSLAALFAFGGRLSDIAGHTRVVVVGVVVFTVASALNGLTPSGSIAEAWIITFRVVQGAGAALLFPSALALVMSSFPLERRGQATAIFFGIAGGLTAVGPIAGGYLAEWTWRAIFWVNIPVAIIGLVLMAFARPHADPRPAPLDWRGLALIVPGMALSVLGLQQSSVWGWTSPLTIGSIVVGVALLVVFVWVEHRTENPLIRVENFRKRAFAAENGVLFFALMVFVPMFFFGSMYAQISLGWQASEAGLYLLIFFAGFAPAVQIGGRLLDRIGAKVPVTVGCAVATVGYALWAWKLGDLSASAQWPYIVVAGAGTGLMLGPSNTDAVNRAGPGAFGEGTGVTQTVRNFGSALGLAVLGTLLITGSTARIESTLEDAGLSRHQADEVAHSLSRTGGGATGSFSPSGSSSQDRQIYEDVQRDFAEANQVVFYGMAGAMGAALLVALFALPGGRQESEEDPGPHPDERITAHH
ncbi:MAG: MFS transporter [Acidimicrobiia bacterium]|nr:MFS transporter [Acidimicrobiia bacterium]